MPDSNFAQLADLKKQIAETELEILQKRKRVENLLAKGADVSELRAEIDALSETLGHLDNCKARLETPLDGRTAKP